MGRHTKGRNRRRLPVVGGFVVASAAVLLTAVASAHPVPETDVAGPPALCCGEVVAGEVALGSWTVSDGSVSANSPVEQVYSVSSLQMTGRSSVRVLPAGVASEQGLQVRTILAARAISAAFPEISQIGGVRADALRWHPQGLALDVMIPDPLSAEGKALGDEIVAFVLKNAVRFGLEHAIWRGVSYSYNGTQGVARSRGSAHGDHYDHVHVATTGGGYPNGGEVYAR